MTWTPSWSRVNESPHPARLGQGLHHETNQAYGAADHPPAQNRRAVDRPGQDRRRGLSCHLSEAADLPPLAAAVRWDACRGTQAADPTGEGERPSEELLAELELEKAMIKDLPEETSEPGTTSQGREGPAGALPGF